MCLLVLVVAGVILRDALRDGTVKRATVPSRIGRGRPRRRSAHDHPARSAMTLVISTAGIGLLLAVVIGLLAVGAALALRAAAGA